MKGESQCGFVIHHGLGWDASFRLRYEDWTVEHGWQRAGCTPDDVIINPGGSTDAKVHRVRRLVLEAADAPDLTALAIKEGVNLP